MHISNNYMCSICGQTVDTGISCGGCCGRSLRDKRVPKGISARDFDFFSWRDLQLLELLNQGKTLQPQEYQILGLPDKATLTQAR